MASPASHVKYSEAHRRWYLQEWNAISGQWTTTWLAPDWAPPPSTPQSNATTSRIDFASPIPRTNSFGAASAGSHGAGPAFGPLFTPPSHLPQGRGSRIHGTYNGPNTSHFEELDRSYYVRAKQFFFEGRVFSVIMNEAAGSTSAPTDYNTSRSLNAVRFKNNVVYTNVRRFVVLRQRREYCYACPIFTYSGRATLKPGVRPVEHSIVYSWGRSPSLKPGEYGIVKAPIAVAMAANVPYLSPASRIYFGIHHPIQYNVKVKEIGFVPQGHLQLLNQHWAEEEGRPEGEKGALMVTPGPRLPPVSEDEEQESNDAGNDDLDPDDNPYGYHPDLAPYIFHPRLQPYGYHKDYNEHGYHPEENRYGYHSQWTPFCYHPLFNIYGYHVEANQHGYHPNAMPYGYHPDANPQGWHQTINKHGYHPTENSDGFHPQYNQHGYHPVFNKKSYHPKYNSRGKYVASKGKQKLATVGISRAKSSRAEVPRAGTSRARPTAAPGENRDEDSDEEEDDEEQSTIEDEDDDDDDDDDDSNDNDDVNTVTKHLSGLNTADPEPRPNEKGKGKQTRRLRK